MADILNKSLDYARDDKITSRRLFGNRAGTCSTSSIVRHRNVVCARCRGSSTYSAMISTNRTISSFWPSN